MAVRMMVYVGLLYQDLIARGEVLADKRLPPVLPIVLYNGGKTWTAATDIADLIPKVPGLVSDYLPQLRYLLIDEGRYAESELAGKKNLMAAVMRFENPQGEDALVELIDQLNDWLADNPELRRIFAIWIRAVLLRKTKSTLALPKVDNLKELKMTLTERFEEWAKAHEQRGIEKGREEGREEGMEKGIGKGEALLLQRLLVRRFGALPTGVTERIANAGTEQIEAWGDKILEAATLDEVFGRQGSLS